MNMRWACWTAAFLAAVRRPNATALTARVARKVDLTSLLKGRPQRKACLWGLALALAAGGCSFGPRALEGTHGRYNETVRRVYEEQLLLNIVHQRYDETPTQLDVSAIAAQYE